MDWVVITARPATTNARIPNTVSKTLASNAAAKASSEIRLNVDFTLAFVSSGLNDADADHGLLYPGCQLAVAFSGTSEGNP